MTAAASNPMRCTLGELAARHSLQWQGEAGTVIEGVCSLAPGKPGRLSFCADPRQRVHLAGSLASAVVLSPKEAAGFTGNALFAPDPALAFAQVAATFDLSGDFTAGVHPAAVVDPMAVIGEGCGIGAGVVIEAGAEIGVHSYIGPHCTIRRGARIGAHSRLEANVYVGLDCTLGDRAHVQPGAVIGARGFGLARAQSGWVEVPQLGRVVIGEDVEIGANTCIDRGALDDTVIEEGVKLDNQIQVAHNVVIGAHTVVAGCTGISGSVTIGRDCLIGGGVGIIGHLSITDRVTISGFTLVTKSITEPGTYTSGMPFMPHSEWLKNAVHLRHLAEIVKQARRHPAGEEP